MIVSCISYKKKSDPKTKFFWNSYSDKKFYIVCIFVLHDFTEFLHLLNQRSK